MVRNQIAQLGVDLRKLLQRGLWVLVWMLLLVIPANSGAQSAYRVLGKVVTAAGDPVSGAMVRLMKIDMSARPMLEPIEETRSDRDGAFSFMLEKPEEDRHYRVETRVDGQTIGSNPFRLDAGQRQVTVNLTMPTVLSGSEHLDVVRDLLVVDPLSGNLRVTEIILLENKTDAVVEVTEKPYIKRIPQAAFNIQFFKQNPDSTAEIGDGQIRFRLRIPPGRHQLYFSYDLPVRGRKVSFTHHLPSGVGMLELLCTVENMGLSILNPNDGGVRPVKETQKKIGDQLYFSQLYAVTAAAEPVEIQVDQLPLTQAMIWYPAGILGGLLALGLFAYLRRKPRTERRS